MYPRKLKISILFLSMFFSLSVFSASPSTPILPSDNIQDPGSLSTPWGGCGPADLNCYVQLTSFNNETVEGLDYSTSTGVLSLTSGYTIPTFASTTAWNNALGASSDAILQNGNSFGNTLILGTNDNQALSFKTNGNDAMTILSNGNVGIGTTTPSEALSVVGNINLTGALINSSLVNGCVEVSNGQLTSTGSNCGIGGGGISSLNGLNGSSQTFATGTALGIGLTVSSVGSTHTFTPTVSAGYFIPLTASSTEWNTAFSWGNHASQNYFDKDIDDTDDITEGVSKLFFTNNRADARITAGTTTIRNMISAGTGISYDAVTGIVTNTGVTSITGNWTGIFDGQEGSYYLNRANQTGTQLALTISDFASSTRNLISSSDISLTYSTTTGALSLTSGYTIPLTASTTEWSNKVSSQWITGGGNVYYNGGNVGIGTSTPSTALTLGTGQISVPFGTAVAPTYSFSSDNNTGIYRVSSGVYGYI